MRHRKIVALLLSAVLLVGLLAGCGSPANLVGIWEAPTEASVLGEGVETPATVPGTVRFVFHEDGSGAIEVNLGSDMPTATEAFEYTLDGKQLTLNLASRIETYNVKVKGDTLVLDNSYADWKLTRQS